MERALFFYLPGYLLWIALTLPLSRLFDYSAKLELWQRGFFLAAVAILAGSTKAIANWLIYFGALYLYHGLGPSGGFWDFMSYLTLFYFVEATIIATVLLVVFFVIELYHKYKEQSLRSAQLEGQLAKAQLQMLKMQLQPHFLFNANNTIAMLIRKGEHEKAVGMIAGMSDLLRSSLDRDNRQRISLQEEMDLLSKYLEIESLRFEDRLDLQIQLAPDTLSALVPSFVLQPLVENAFKHGFAKSIGIVLLRIESLKEGEVLHLRVFNSGPPLPEAPSATGIGLSNTRQRLQQLYEGQYQLELKNEQNGVLVPPMPSLFHQSRLIMPPIRTLVIDDEKQAREGIALLLEKDQDLHLLEMCQNGLEAIASISRHRPDLIFLDIQMPEVNGFEVLNSLPEDQRPLVIFVTAYDQFALKAFELHAIDYLLKPFSDERFFHALDYAKQLLEQAATDSQQAKMNQLMEHYFRSLPAEQKARLIEDFHQEQIVHTNRLAIKSDGKVHFLPLNHIHYLEGYDAYVKIHTSGKTYLVKDRLKSMEQKLPAKDFLRIHKSYIVNTQFIQTLEPHFNGDFFLQLSTGQKLKGSRTYRKMLEHRFLK